LLKQKKKIFKDINTNALGDYTTMIRDFSLLLSEPEIWFPIHTQRRSTWDQESKLTHFTKEKGHYA
jgi:hypothetical protein